MTKQQRNIIILMFLMTLGLWGWLGWTMFHRQPDTFSSNCHAKSGVVVTVDNHRRCATQFINP